MSRTTWEMRTVTIGPENAEDCEEVQALLADGWEPLAVACVTARYHDRGDVRTVAVFRRAAPAGGSDVR